MKIKRFTNTYGNRLDEIQGQRRFAYTVDSFEDFYDMIEWIDHGGYQGSVLRFYDYESGELYCPFEKQRNVIYGRPIYSEGSYYFLQGDFNRKKITLYKYLPGECIERIVELSTEDVNLYNFTLIGSQVHIISADDKFVCYYPQPFVLEMGANEGLILIDDNKVYINAWIEEGWDHEKNCASEQYKYYERIIVKDFEGNIISDEIGSLNHAPDGSWWIS